MTFDINMSAVVQALLVAVIAYAAREFQRMGKVIERLDERTNAHDNRLARLERKVA